MKSHTGEPVLATCSIQFITAASASHAEIASSRDARSNYPCRKCDWLVKTEATFRDRDYGAARRSESIFKKTSIMGSM